ncbi:unnamed protein product, partial [Oppiella nova]
GILKHRKLWDRECQQHNGSCDRCVRDINCFYCSSDKTCHKYTNNEHLNVMCGYWDAMYWSTCYWNIRVLAVISSLTFGALLLFTTMIVYLMFARIHEWKCQRQLWQQRRHQQLAAEEIRRAHRWQNKHQFAEKPQTQVVENKGQEKASMCPITSTNEWKRQNATSVLFPNSPASWTSTLQSGATFDTHLLYFDGDLGISLLYSCANTRNGHSGIGNIYTRSPDTPLSKTMLNHLYDVYFQNGIYDVLPLHEVRHDDCVPARARAQDNNNRPHNGLKRVNDLGHKNIYND